MTPRHSGRTIEHPGVGSSGWSDGRQQVDDFSARLGIQNTDSVKESLKDEKNGYSFGGGRQSGNAENPAAPPGSGFSECADRIGRNLWPGELPQATAERG